MQNYDEIIKSLTVEEAVGQLMCIGIPNGYTMEDMDKIDELCKRTLPGSIFMAKKTPEFIKAVTDIANKYVKIPVMIVTDIENGPGSCIDGVPELPQPMAWGACNDEKLIEEAGEETAKICRLHGIHWTFGPIVDLNINPRNAESNIRSVSDNPDRVIKIAGAHMRGLMKSGYMVTSCKHFPGQGTDDRNSHFCTTINPLSKEEWWNTFGKVYKAVIEQGTASIMVGHSTLPFYQKQKDEFFGEYPVCLSRELMTDLLKGELGFDGCIVSDAMSMIGIAARMPLDRLAIEFFNAGGDNYLFPTSQDFECTINAVKSGEISKDRLYDAVRRNLVLKEKARLFEDQEKVLAEIKLGRDFVEIAQEVADKSVKVVRNLNGTIPFSDFKSKKVLMFHMIGRFDHEPPTGKELEPFKKAFEDRGYEVTEYYRGSYAKVKEEIVKDYDLVLVNCKMSSRDYHGSSLRVGWDEIMIFWHAAVLQHKNVIFTSFGDPYKIYEFPYLKEYINAFSLTRESQEAVAKVILGEIEPTAKNPVNFPPFFDYED